MGLLRAPTKRELAVSKAERGAGPPGHPGSTVVLNHLPLRTTADAVGRRREGGAQAAKSIKEATRMEASPALPTTVSLRKCANSWQQAVTLYLALQEADSETKLAV